MLKWAHNPKLAAKYRKTVSTEKDIDNSIKYGTKKKKKYKRTMSLTDASKKAVLPFSNNLSSRMNRIETLRLNIHVVQGFSIILPLALGQQHHLVMVQH